MCSSLLQTSLKRPLALYVELLRHRAGWQNFDSDLRDSTGGIRPFRVFHFEEFGVLQRYKAARIDECMCRFFAVHDEICHWAGTLLSPDRHRAILTS